jgi:hypothetical protein
MMKERESAQMASYCNIPKYLSASFQRTESSPFARGNLFGTRTQWESLISLEWIQRCNNPDIREIQF